MSAVESNRHVIRLTEHSDLIEIICGVCNKVIQPKQLQNPIAISKNDSENNVTRDHIYLCCSHSWLMSQNGELIDCGLIGEVE